ncbi:hypothetical protein JAAARDRAFT_44883 [Jaapia argillacea MUCL 33604]|uniref:Uncharacterized protein n=1 Tax=Jaapia argillacea MUCL 33604 TaxID=933084 RepID=A0A067QGD6_9AGAM|nr:hypothetical protein JAAARDRAFT_44883 [Jaapia argillacea MUCL 33604]
MDGKCWDLTATASLMDSLMKLPKIPMENKRLDGSPMKVTTQLSRARFGTVTKEDRVVGITMLLELRRRGKSGDELETNLRDPLKSPPSATRGAEGYAGPTWDWHNCTRRAEFFREDSSDSIDRSCGVLSGDGGGRIWKKDKRDEARQGSTDIDPLRRTSLKRPYPDPPSRTGSKYDDQSDSERPRSPRMVRVKEEEERDALESPPPPPRSGQSSQHTFQDVSGAPTPSSVRPQPSKRRRVTISGISHPLNTNLPPAPSERTTPISPVVMGFTLNRDDPAAIEQVRSMITVKQKQKALIEQRRESAAGLISTGAHNNAAPSVNVVNPSSASGDRERLAVPSISGRTGGRSPTAAGSSTSGGGAHRGSVASIAIAASNQSGTINSPRSQRPPSPSALAVPTQNPHSHIQDPSSFSQGSGGANPTTLPPPPISFARRRAGQIGGMKKKPADLVINPRDPQGSSQPMIQSAPAIPRAGQQPGRFPMMLPTLPSVMGTGGPSTRRVVASQVPPTPTRLGMPRTGGSIQSHSAGGRSPPNTSVPIASTLVPPTPASLHHPGYSSEKSAFLAPFETFYEALAGSKELKNWLQAQLQKSQTLLQDMQSMQQQHHRKMEETMEAMMDKKIAPMREEIYGLRRRVEELEEILGQASGESEGPSRGVGPIVSAVSSSSRRRGSRQSLRNGLPPSTPMSSMPPGQSAIPDMQYTFPPVTDASRRPDFVRGPSSPGRASSIGGDGNDGQSLPGSGRGSPVGFDVSRRMSVSAMRYDPPPAHLIENSRAGPSSHNQSLHTYAISNSQSHTRSPVTKAKSATTSNPPPPLQRNDSFTGHPRSSQPNLDWEREKPPTTKRTPPGGDKDIISSPVRSNSRRNSIIMPQSSVRQRSTSPMDDG